MNGTARVGVLTFGCAILLMIPLLATPVLPLIDFYNHIARYYVLSHLDEARLAANYASAWALLPNLGLDALATPLLGVMPPLAAARLIAALILLAQFSGVIFLHRTLHRRADPLPAVLLLGLLYSYIFNWGFSNFLLGLGLVFWNLGLWFRLRERPVVASAAASAGALAIFFCHGFAFAIYGVLLGALEFGRWLHARERTVGGLGRKAALLAAQAIVPVVLFLRMPTSSAEGQSGSTLDAIRQHASGGTLAERLDFEFWYRLRTIFRVAESPYLLLDLATFIGTALLIGFALWKGWMRLHRWCWPALIGLILLCAAMPPSLFGVGYVSDRIPLVVALLLVSALAMSEPIGRGARAVLAALFAIGLVRIAAIFIGWSAYAGDYADYTRVMAAVPEGALVIDILPTGEDKRDGLTPRCQMYRPLAVLTHGSVAPLFASPSQQPLRIKGPLESAVVESNGPNASLHARPGFYDERLAMLGKERRYDYAIICGRERLTRPLPPGVRIAAESGGIALLQLR